jgi:hypothetical protein
MALTTGTKTLVDATATQPDSAANALSHGADHKAIHAALKEVYGIRRYRCLLTQAGTAAPTATVLENTLVTTPTWTRVSAGVYRLTFATGEALAAKRFVTLSGANINVLTGFYAILSLTSTDDQVTISMSGGVDDVLLNLPFMVEVYP